MRPLLAALVAIALSICAPARAETLVVFAAASLKGALDEAADAFADETGREVAISYAGSSALARQIEQGAPADLFVSANADWMDHLQAAGLLAPGTRIDLLANRIALVAPASSDIEARIAPGFDLASLLGADGRLVMAETTSVPAGIYGRAALEHLGLWESVSGRLAQAENVRAALALVSRGEAPLGIVYTTDAAADPGVRIVDVFPEETHPPIVYPAARLAESPRGEAAERLLAFLETPRARAIFERHGFIVLAE